MSVGGPSPLGTLLLQRLDTAPGGTLSQQSNIVSGARPDAVTQANTPERVAAAQNETQRHPRQAVDRATEHATQQGRGAVDKARLDARTAELLLARNAPSTSTTPSAPTTLGHAAKTILALLANFPDVAAAVQGKRPLLLPQQNPTAAARAAPASGQPATAPTANAVGRGATAPISTGVGTNAATAVLAGAGTGQATASMVMQLAQSLSHALQTSGMFYESHLSNLAFGKQTASQLMQEPQAQAGRANSAAAAPTPANSQGTNPSPAAPSSDQAVPRGGDAPAQTAPAAQAARSDASSPGQTNTNAPATAPTNQPPIPGLEPQTQLLVRQQLDVLANQTFAWRGEAWPDAPMEWEVSRREPSEDESGAQQTEHWATRINIHLPALGQVQARLTLAGQQLVMQLVAPASADVLSEHAEALRGRYSAQGLQLTQFSIAADEFPNHEQ